MKNPTRGTGNRFIFLALACFSAALFGTSSVWAEESFEEMQEKHSDFVLHLNTHVLPHYLNYKGTTLNPVAAVDVDYKVRDPQSQTMGESQKYEDLWFHQNHGIGVFRYAHLPLHEGTNGVAIVDDTTDAATQTAALSNAIVRLLLDVHLEHAGMTVFVPNHLFHHLASDLSLLNFHEAGTLTSQQRGILFHMVSIPHGYDNYFWFEKQ